MSQLMLAVLLIAVLLSVVQFAWLTVAAHVDAALLPPAARHRVAWLMSHSGRVQLTLLAIAVVAAAARLAQ